MYLNDFNAATLIIVLLGWYLLQAIAYYKFFEKAGEQGWIGFVPFYNYYVHMKIVGRPTWWVALLFVPVINFFVALTIHLDLLKSFDRFSYFDQAVGVILAPFYMVFVAYGNTKYVGKAVDIPKKPKSQGQEWFEAIVFAVFAATCIRWVFMEAYVIPTPSMEKSLLVGDFLFVSKIEYGPRTPKTPIQIPLTHAKIWGTDVPSYVSSVQLPQFRLPSLGKVERNDVVVFNYPPEFQHPKDLRTHYIKRCVGIPGDTVVVENSQVIVNGVPSDNPELMQHSYRVFTKETIRDRVFEEIDISEISKQAFGYGVQTSQDKADKLAALPFVDRVEQVMMEPGVREPGFGQPIFPDFEFYPWNKDQYGPLEVPFRGMTIPIDERMLAKYGSTIRDYEDLQDVSVTDGELVVNGDKLSEYTFKKDYYFMMGDNRHNSLDSRYWGFVPEDFIVGEASFIWMSHEANKGLFSGVRWSRLFNGIK
ncbi:MAG: signal peptidase I [Cytophagales bacterium]|nr:signal peptidase I [Cytophagales bacterium]